MKVLCDGRRGGGGRGGGGGAWVNVVVMGPNAKGKGWFNEGRVKDAVDDWPSVVVIGSKINNGGGTGAEARIGWLSSRGSGGSTQ